MSHLNLKEFHSFLEQLIEESSRDGRFSIDKIISAIVTRYPERLANVQAQINDLGLRALIRNNCRAKNSSASTGPDLFGHYRLGKRISVPYHDEHGKLRWDKKRRSDLSFGDLDEILARWSDRPTRQSQERLDFDDIARKTQPYRNKARSIGEALQMAQEDGR
ncbi:hypothetical protein [Mesorhizobium sp. B2-3-15]|uniref:hypothetical protein n=1 Tax=Mesorhizobium sp. B2-3-15 TaxID=2589949 RepID=UPI0011289C4E|nr:hypothetical protein [Mesorhizobium sp. B2-3-15]TPL62956.1 hypothetical protein FJ954_31275 [Mesorhizobium sp. B2-3-15]